MASRAKKRDAGPELARVLYALGDPIRLEIVRQLARQGEIPCLGFGIDMPKSSLSHHFRVLREAGILGSRAEGTSIFNFLQVEELERRFPGLLPGILGNL
ncbi:MAG: helix-turn-helix transcriptional regulator [Planctomycetes bacterium]|nr:helix-turn-helix transcriptional regulator [Planctomycetota bacterium]